MMSTISVGSTTSVCSLSDQVKKYKPHSIAAAEKLSSNQQGESGGKARGAKTKAIESLTTMCIKILTNRFCIQPSFGGIPQKFQPEITARLPTDLDITVSAPHILDENYWKRCCLTREGWSNFQIAQHGVTWRQLYLELNLQEELENFDPATQELESLLATIRASQDSIFTLTITQLLSHIDLDEVCAVLPNLTQLNLTYGVKQIGMKYERMLFGMKISDATSLARCIKYSSTLTTLTLPGNLLDDDLLRMLMTGLIKNSTITHLDLSHNKITNHGARLLSKLLGPKSVITSLNLCDNQIHAEGGRYLSRGLRYNSSLGSLNLRLNRLTDEGGRLLLEGIADTSRLRYLNLSSNSLGTETARALAELLQASYCPFRVLDLTANEFNQEDAEALRTGLKDNTRVTGFDLRVNQIPKDADCLLEISKMVRHNEIDIRTQET